MSCWSSDPPRSLRCFAVLIAAALWGCGSSPNAPSDMTTATVFVRGVAAETYALQPSVGLRTIVGDQALAGREMEHIKLDSVRGQPEVGFLLVLPVEADYGTLSVGVRALDQQGCTTAVGSADESLANADSTLTIDLVPVVKVCSNTTPVLLYVDPPMLLLRGQVYPAVYGWGFDPAAVVSVRGVVVQSRWYSPMRINIELDLAGQPAGPAPVEVKNPVGPPDTRDDLLGYHGS